MPNLRRFRRHQPAPRQLSPPVKEHYTGEHIDPTQAKSDLKTAIAGSDQTLIEIHTALQIFPITLKLDRAKLAATQTKLFVSTGLLSLPIVNIMNVAAEVGLILGAVKVYKNVVNADEPHTFGPFWRRDALNFTSIAQGYVIALQRHIDLSGLSIKELRDMLRELGRDEHVPFQET